MTILMLALSVSLDSLGDCGDIDNSGTLDLKEALFVGTALSVDAAAIGLASAAYLFSFPLFLAATAVINYILLRLGESIGRKSGRLIPEEKLKAVSGILILLMGLLRLL